MRILDGKKTYLTCLVAAGMVVCQMQGHYVFSQEEWAAVGISGAFFMRMGMNKKRGI